MKNRRDKGHRCSLFLLNPHSNGEINSRHIGVYLENRAPTSVKTIPKNKEKRTKFNQIKIN